MTAGQVLIPAISLIDLSLYVTNDSLSSTLSSYVTVSSLNSTLSSYVTVSSLNSTLSNYSTKTYVGDFFGNPGVNEENKIPFWNEDQKKLEYIDRDKLKGFLSATIYHDTGSSVSAGDFTDENWIIRELNFLYNQDNIVTGLSSNVFGLGIGTYEISWRTPAFGVGYHQSRLVDATTNMVIKNGSTACAPVGVQNDSCGKILISIDNGIRYFRLEHRAQTFSSDGLGVGAPFGQNLHTEIFIRKARD